MKAIVKPFTLGTFLLIIMCVAGTSDTPLKFSLAREAEAGLFIAPVRRAAVVTSVAVASSTANANAAAQANANAAAQANAAAAQANAAAAAAGPPPVGTIVTTLPPGCVQETLNNVAYQRCGSTYYKASMMGSNLVFVVAQP